LWFLRLFVRDFIHGTEMGYRFESQANPCIWKCNNYAASYVVRSPDQRETADLPETLARGKRTILFVGQGPTAHPIPGTHRVMLKYK